MEPEKQAFACWCLVEVFGHVKLAGYVTKQTVGGCSFIRVDVPDVPAKLDEHGRELSPAQKGFTRLFGQGAIYSISPVEEDVARQLARTVRDPAVKPWDLPEEMRRPMAALPGPRRREEEEDFYGDDEEEDDDGDPDGEEDGLRPDRAAFDEEEVRDVAELEDPGWSRTGK